MLIPIFYTPPDIAMLLQLYYSLRRIEEESSTRHFCTEFRVFLR